MACHFIVFVAAKNEDKSWTIEMMYEKQNHKCAKCKKVFDYSDMHGHHKKSWARGGRTVIENLQMLCQDCNLELGGMWF